MSGVRFQEDWVMGQFDESQWAEGDKTTIKTINPKP
jgi:hypothetical protein